MFSPIIVKNPGNVDGVGMFFEKNKIGSPALTASNN